jgi:hypothetical protein
MAKHLSLLMLGFVAGLVVMFLWNLRVVPQNTDETRLQIARSCAEAADRFYHARYPENGSEAERLLVGGESTNLGNHYNAELHRCLVSVRTVSMVSTAEEIRDAMETTRLALRFTAFVDAKSGERKTTVTFEKFGQDVSSTPEAFQAWMTQLMTK